MIEWLEDLELELSKNADKSRAIAQIAYMKNHFDFFGIASSTRKDLATLWIKKYNLKATVGIEKRNLILALFQMEQREFHYIAIDFLNSFKTSEIEQWDGDFLETLIRSNSWWDSVDSIASNYLGKYVKKFPAEGFKLMEQWANSENLWLMRSTLIFQLKYGNLTDFDFLKKRIYQFRMINEFFIQKAIGWSLRQYSKFNKDSVKHFLTEVELSNLARREAAKYL
jgi:3-methyladenine DNA glycosylase AlkD